MWRHRLQVNTVPLDPTVDQNSLKCTLLKISHYSILDSIALNICQTFIKTSICSSFHTNSFYVQFIQKSFNRLQKAKIVFFAPPPQRVLKFWYVFN